MHNEEWYIKPRGSKCCKCERAFADGQHYISILSLGEAGYERNDFCPDCWAKRDDNLAVLSCWRGLFKVPEPPPAEPVKKETAEALLRRMIEDGDDSRLNAMFILAVMLERRRILIEREVKQQPDGARLRVYEHRAKGDTFVIRDPMLRMDQLQDVQREVLAMLEPESGNA